MLFFLGGGCKILPSFYSKALEKANTSSIEKHIDRHSLYWAGPDDREISKRMLYDELPLSTPPQPKQTKCFKDCLKSLLHPNTWKVLCRKVLFVIESKIMNVLRFCNELCKCQALTKEGAIHWTGIYQFTCDE